MRLTTGNTLGPYEIIAAIGAGGWRGTSREGYEAPARRGPEI
ncbi:MAG: hypothetical protein WBF30_04655 [Candidatus Acidiferrales bacterium]